MSEQLYVALQADGSYIKMILTKSQLGTRTRFESVSLSEADAVAKYLWKRCSRAFTLIPVTVSRVVTIQTEQN